MKHEYVFRGEREPYAPDPKDQRAREEAVREAEELVNREPPQAQKDLSTDAELDEIVGDYQVGGLGSYGASSTQPGAEPASDTPSRDTSRDT